MDDLTPFEQQLRDRLRSEVGQSVGAFDAGRVAHAAIGRRSVGDHVLNRLRVNASMGLLAPRRVALVALVALLLVAFAVVGLAVGGFLAPSRLPVEPRLVLLTGAGIALANSDGSHRAVIYPANGQERVESVGWAPGGDHILARGIDGDGWMALILDRGGQVTARIRLQARVAEIAWSPDGRQLAVLDGTYTPATAPLVRDAHLDVVGLDGEQEWRASLPSPFTYLADVPSLTWAPGGAAIALTGQITKSVDDPRASTWLIDPVARGVRELTPAGASYDYAPAWSADGRLFIARTGATAAEIWELDRMSEGATRVLQLTRNGCGSACLPGLVAQILPAPDGSDVAVRGPQGLSVFDLRTGAEKDLFPPADLVGPVVWSDDGASLLCLYLRAGDQGTPGLVSVTVGTGATAMIVPDVGMFDLSQAIVQPR